MLKRIGVQQLTLGMYLQEFCGSWMEHPFLRSSFVLRDPKDIDAILASSIQEVWIDCAKGLDVAAGESGISDADAQAQVQAELEQVAAEQRPVVSVSAAQEMARAARICLRSKQEVLSMFENVRMGRLVEVRGARQVVEDIAGSIWRNPGALISLARIKKADDYTYMHSVAVCAMMIALARQLGWNDAQTRSAGLAGLLHDLGKAATPMAVLKKPGKLTDAEFVIIKEHSAAGFQLLAGGAIDDPVVLDVCLHHHEKIDGSGYPDQIKGEQISLAARMGAVCDVYDAITSNRRYKAGWDPAVSMRKMAEWSGHFESTTFHAFVKCMGIYPVGSLVRLSSGRIGVVVEQSSDSLTKPRVKVFFDTRLNRRMTAQLLDLSDPDNGDAIAAREDPAQWQFPDLHELWSGLAQAPW